jgi:hypothetical protein
MSTGRTFAERLSVAASIACECVENMGLIENVYLSRL